jgi:hypothetical protein
LAASGLAETMRAGRIAGIAGGRLQHRLAHAGVERSGGTRIQIDFGHGVAGLPVESDFSRKTERDKIRRSFEFDQGWGRRGSRSWMFSESTTCDSPACSRFVAIMPVLALPAVNRRLDRWVFGGEELAVELGKIREKAIGKERMGRGGRRPSGGIRWPAGQRATVEGTPVNLSRDGLPDRLRVRCGAVAAGRHGAVDGDQFRCVPEAACRT